MAHTDKTMRPNDYALRFIKRDKTGYPRLPRIVVREPRKGDVHPLTRDQIWYYLAMVPPAYVYGLKAVELRPRKDALGCPYGLYSPRDKRIWLYSCPAREWHFSNEIWHSAKAILTWGAQIVESEGSSGDIAVQWNDPVDIELFLVDVLLHELGHHYVHQYKSSRGMPGTRPRHEVVAEVHVKKQWQQIIAKQKRIEKKRAMRGDA